MKKFAELIKLMIITVIVSCGITQVIMFVMTPTIEKVGEKINSFDAKELAENETFNDIMCFLNTVVSEEEIDLDSIVAAVR